MAKLDKKDSFTVVTALSNLNITSEDLKFVDVRELVSNIHNSQQEVQDAKSELERTRAAKKEGNFIGNWWNDREDAIKDAQMNLNSAVGELTSQSSKLVVFNTAISKILIDQQNMLQNQQNLLDKQTKKIQEQTETITQQQQSILDAHNRLHEQQLEIQKANEGLLEAKGLTSEQAKRLVGIVDKTEIIKKDIINIKKYIIKNNQDTVESIKGISTQMQKSLQVSIMQERENIDVKFESFHEHNEVRLKQIYNQNISELHEISHKSHQAIENQKNDMNTRFINLEDKSYAWHQENQELLHQSTIERQASEEQMNKKNKYLLYYIYLAMTVSLITLCILIYIIAR